MGDEKQAAECDKKCAVCPPAKMIAEVEQLNFQSDGGPLNSHRGWLAINNRLMSQNIRLETVRQQAQQIDSLARQLAAAKEHYENVVDELTKVKGKRAASQNKWTAEQLKLQEQLAVVEAALEESVKLQSHYANLLNMYDGGKRIQFASGDEWIKRLVNRKSRKTAVE